MATHVATGRWLPKEKKWPRRQGLPQGNRAQRPARAPTTTRGGTRTNSIQKGGEAGGSSKHPASSAGGHLEAPAGAALLLREERAFSWRAPAQLRSSGKPGAERLCEPETPGQPPPPCPPGLPTVGHGSTALASERAGVALGPGQAAHLAMAGARLVHEGAVLAGPHGGRGGVRGAPDGSVLVEARKLHPDCACRMGEKQLSVFLHREDAPPVWTLHHCLVNRKSTCPGLRQPRDPRCGCPGHTQNPTEHSCYRPHCTRSPCNRGCCQHCLRRPSPRGVSSSEPRE